ncbi:hypothetical protein GYMLUDRAFT_33651 [Collybiopsis luxurians FD-317 M1]|nr:hypothetical protein GYMLUDRAFT_33651 [Collybiopsis luxurians FD-317 M1]
MASILRQQKLSPPELILLLASLYILRAFGIMHHSYPNFSNQLQLQFAVEDLDRISTQTTEAYHQQQAHDHSPDMHLYSFGLPGYMDSSYDANAAFYTYNDPGPRNGDAVPGQHTSAPTSPATSMPSHFRNLSLPTTPPRHTQTTLSSEDHADLEESEDPIPPLPPNASEEQRKAWVKRRNTRSAKLSRMRRMLYIRRLEEDVETLKREKERWYTRAQTLRQLLISNGISIPPFIDSQ